MANQFSCLSNLHKQSRNGIEWSDNTDHHRMLPTEYSPPTRELPACLRLIDLQWIQQTFLHQAHNFFLAQRKASLMSLRRQLTKIHQILTASTSIHQLFVYHSTECHLHWLQHCHQCVLDCQHLYLLIWLCRKRTPKSWQLQTPRKRRSIYLISTASFLDRHMIHQSQIHYHIYIDRTVLMSLMLSESVKKSPSSITTLPSTER